MFYIIHDDQKAISIDIFTTKLYPLTWMGAKKGFLMKTNSEIFRCLSSIVWDIVCVICVFLYGKHIEICFQEIISLYHTWTKKGISRDKSTMRIFLSSLTTTKNDLMM